MSATLMTAFFSRVADKVATLNPQLLREWQGRLRWRNVILTTVLSLIVQGLVLMQTLAELPGRTTPRHRFCLKTASNANCQLGANGLPIINWPYVSAEIFQALCFILVWGLVVGGIYLLVADLSSETKRGTVNFLRMSPLSPRKILLGKILGVPVLLYVGLGLVCPLHLMTGMIAGYPLWQLLLFYGLLGAIALCFYTASLWFSALLQWLHGLQALLLSGASFFVLLVGFVSQRYKTTADWFFFFNPLHILSGWQPKGLSEVRLSLFHSAASYSSLNEIGWFFLPVGSHVVWFSLMFLANALVLGLWFWVVMERKFQTPTSTTLSKRQSYFLTLCLSVIMLGFDMQSLFGGSYIDPLLGYVISMLIWCIILLFLILPSKQRLLDWARYRHQQFGARHGSDRGYRQLADLISHDGSPLVGAYVVNLAIVAGVLLVGFSILLFTSKIDISEGLQSCSVWFFTAAALLVCALVLQLIALSNLLHWRWISMGAIAAMIAGWPIVLIMAGIEPHRHDGFLIHLWLTTVFPLIGLDEAYGVGILFIIALQMIVISALSFVLYRHCQVLGQSEWKALMESRRNRESAPA